MVDFTIRVAGRSAAVRAMYDTTRIFCKDYLWAGEADFALEVTGEDIAFERAENQRIGYNDSDAYLEVIALLRKTAQRLLEYDTLLFHGSVIAVDGAGYLFTAPSGTGKSTHTRLWRQLLGRRVVTVNDDKPFLRITEEGVMAYGSPWCGKHGLNTSTSVPLKAVCILERGEENQIRPISPKAALATLFQQSGRPQDAAQMSRYMELLDRLAGMVKFFHLCCNMTLEAAQVAYEAMACMSENLK